MIGPVDVNVAEGVNTIVYAWGSLADDNLDVAVQTIKGLHSSPNSVPSGELGLAADNGTPVLPLIALGAALLGGAAFAVRRNTVSQR